jgi:hypothetical protein
MIKLYLLVAIVEVFDRLMCGFGQDALDSLYWNTTRRPHAHPRLIVSLIVVYVYSLLHSCILFIHVSTNNVAMNSADHVLLSLLIGGNFAEIKGIYMEIHSHNIQSTSRVIGYLYYFYSYIFYYYVFSNV